MTLNTVSQGESGEEEKLRNNDIYDNNDDNDNDNKKQSFVCFAIQTRIRISIFMKKKSVEFHQIDHEHWYNSTTLIKRVLLVKNENSLKHVNIFFIF